MTINQQNFEKYCFAAESANSDIFDSIRSEISASIGALKFTILGPATFAALDSLPIEFQELCEKFVCLDAFQNAIPQLDLAITENGFAVISNQNMAPASADRVQRLFTRIKNACEDCTDEIFNYLRGNAIWQDSEIAQVVFRSLIWSAEILRHHGFPDAHRSKLDELRIKITIEEKILMNKISDALYQELCDSVRKKTSTPLQLMTIDYCTAIIIAGVSEQHNKGIHVVVNALLRFLDENIDSFQTYRNSSSYTANHFQPYENTADDKGYFWG